MSTLLGCASTVATPRCTTGLQFDPPTAPPRLLLHSAQICTQLQRSTRSFKVLHVPHAAVRLCPPCYPQPHAGSVFEFFTRFCFSTL
ncbi:putative pyrimidodiazepine synthase [Sesbania bispinosa]|nr:putative pyrimidodiazepine synthase [Sesbania bispinosa]